MNLDIQIIKSAYKKLKSYIYYDNTLIFLKKDIAKFEIENRNNLETKFKNIKNVLEGKDEELLKMWLNNVSFYLVPKKFDIKEDLETNIVKNLYYDHKLDISKINIFIRLPIELYIIDILWIMYIGEKLDKKLKDNVYGYRLMREEGVFKKNSYKLFHKYYEKYQAFRDSAVEEAINLHKQNKSVTFLNLDIKEFFYNINVDLDSLLKGIEIQEEFLIEKLNNILKRIHDKYHEILKNDKIYLNKTNTKINSYLPIGLMSSSVIANYSLKEFDEFILYKIQPQFYGRYVDDILLVFNREITKIDDLFELFKFFNKDKKKIEFKINKKINLEIIIKNYKNKFVLQQEKVKLFYFNKNYSIAILKKFKKQIDENSSIVKDLPESKSVFDRLEESTISISYESTINKISSIKETKIDKLNLSLNLSYIIRLLLLTYDYDNKNKKELIKATNEQIRTIFYGKNIFELHQYWEKIFVYYLISKSYSQLDITICNILKKINDFRENDNINLSKISLIKKYFKEYLKITLSLALATNIYFLEKQLRKHTFKCLSDNLHDEFLNEVFKYSELFSEANLFKQNFTVFPILNYLDLKVNKYKNNIFLELSNLENVTFNTHKIEYSPRFIRYDEILFFKQLINLHTNDSLNLDKVLNEYFDINKLNDDNIENKDLKKSYPNLQNNIIFIQKV